MKKTAVILSEMVSGKYSSLKIDVRDLAKPGTLGRIREFEPDIIHYFHGPTITSLAMLRCLGLWTRAKTVVSATHPTFTSSMVILGPLLRVDCMLVQSRLLRDALRPYAGCVRVVSSGVDLAVHHPVSPARRRELRRVLGLSEDGKIGLHVGSLVSTRNLDWFHEIPDGLDEMVILASTSTVADPRVVSSLGNSGCKVIHEYKPEIQQYYQACDVYIFPTAQRTGSIDFPLSVLEAMANGLPVVSYPNATIVDNFTEGDGLVFVSNPQDLGSAIKKAMQEGDESRLRDRASRFSWDKVMSEVVDAYEATGDLAKHA